MQFIALTSIGIENLLVDELTELGATVSKQTVGSVRFEADSLLAQKVCLSTRFATRVLMLIEEKEGEIEEYNSENEQDEKKKLNPEPKFQLHPQLMNMTTI